MANIITILIITVILGSAISKLIIEKKRGNKCVGCPYGKPQSKKCGCNH